MGTDKGNVLINDGHDVVRPDARKFSRPISLINPNYIEKPDQSGLEYSTGRI